MNDLPKCKLCGADAAMHKVFGGIKYCCSSETCTMHDVLMFKSQWRTLMTQQAGDSTDKLRFKSACEISGEKHPEYVRGYEAAMGAVCNSRQAEPVRWMYEDGSVGDIDCGHTCIPLYTAQQAQPAPTNKEHDNAKDAD